MECPSDDLPLVLVLDFAREELSKAANGGLSQTTLEYRWLGEISQRSISQPVERSAELSFDAWEQLRIERYHAAKRTRN